METELHMNESSIAVEGKGVEGPSRLRSRSNNIEKKSSLNINKAPVSETTTEAVTYPEVKVAGGKVYSFFKRFFDIFSSALVLILLGWIIIILMFIKFCEDGHNPIYTSIRVGKNGRRIKFHKIRSMVPNADEKKKELIAKGENEASGPVFKKKDDPRITRFGKFLRKTSLDELPQIWDVFVGRISVVGPRSPLPEEVEKYDPYQRHRLDVKGGLVCSWQITKNRHKLPFEEWVRLDIDYIEHRSFALDFKIIFKAVFFVLTDRTGE